MDGIVQHLQNFQSHDLTYEILGQYVKSLDVSKISYEDKLPPILNPNKYNRNILLLEPLEVVVLHWPPEVESAIHYHQGFWGYVLVLEGTCDNVEYEHKGNQLIENRTIRAIKGGILDEPDGVIHKIVNPSKTDHLVTLHFYYPALETLDDLVLYEPEKRTIGVLNEKAQTASFEEPEEHFKSLKENAFEFVPFSKSVLGKSHRILPILPKPKSNQIREMINRYYGEQAEQYDFFDLKHETRNRFIDSINCLIAEDLTNQDDLDHVLAIACGTGRRAVKIRELSDHDYRITCVDMSEEMCCKATERGVTTYPGDWLEVQVGEEQFDIVTFLYAFGHIPTRSERKKALQKIYDKLKPGGMLYLDLFNANDENEWGPKALQTFNKMGLHRFGYEKGDVFYKKTNGKSIAFLHYFEQDSICELLREVGFEIGYVKNVGYSHKCGQILSEEEGILFIKAIKPNYN